MDSDWIQSVRSGFKFSDVVAFERNLGSEGGTIHLRGGCALEINEEAMLAVLARSGCRDPRQPGLSKTPLA